MLPVRLDTTRLYLTMGGHLIKRVS